MYKNKTYSIMTLSKGFEVTAENTKFKHIFFICIVIYTLLYIAIEYFRFLRLSRCISESEHLSNYKKRVQEKNEANTI